MDLRTPVKKPLPFDPISEGRELCEQHWGHDTAIVMVALTSIIRAEQMIVTDLNRILRPFQLTFSRYEALIRLGYSRQGSMSLGRLSERLQVHPTSITNTVDRLEAAGLVVRVPNETDRRAMHAAITPRGRQVAHDATLVLQREFKLPGLTNADLEEITNLVRRLRRSLGDFIEPSDEDKSAQAEAAKDEPQSPDAKQAGGRAPAPADLVNV